MVYFEYEAEEGAKQKRCMFINSVYYTMDSQMEITFSHSNETSN